MLGWARTVLLSLAMSGSLPAPPGQFFSCHLVVVAAVVDDVVIDVVVVDVADVVDVIVGDLSPEQPRRESLLESK